MCEHLAKLDRRRAAVHPSSHGCQECLAEGEEWVQLRLCMTCGHVGCCDDSPGRHATGHHHATKHPVIKSYEPGEDWAWCYVHEEMVERVPTLGDESPPEHYSAPA